MYVSRKYSHITNKKKYSKTASSPTKPCPRPSSSVKERTVSQVMMGHLVEVAMRAARRLRNCRRCHLLWRLKPHRVLVCRLHRRSNRRVETCHHSWRHKLQIFQPHSTRSRLQVSRRVRPLASRRARSILTSAIALRSRENVWSTPKPPLVSPLTNRHKFHSSWGSLIQALFQQRFRCWSARLNARLNRFMVNYDIIRVLKNHVGYKSWDEVSITEREYCFKNYSPKSGLPMWNTVQENYAWDKILRVWIFFRIVGGDYIDASKYSGSEYFILLFVNRVELFFKWGMSMFHFELFVVMEKYILCGAYDLLLEMWFQGCASSSCC
jgi:hypothetical protein